MRDVVSFEQSKKLFELGFDEDCQCTYIEYPDGSVCCVDGGLSNHEKQFNTYPAPTVYQVCTWLREKYNILVGSSPLVGFVSPKYNLCVNMWSEKKGMFKNELLSASYNTMGDALKEGITFALGQI